ncbi:unnamed protein product [Rotaria magnacalcarata]
MPNQGETEEDREQQKSKKPADTAFKQQRLPAWQPIITANTALPVFLIIGLTFIPIGIVLVVTSERVLEYDIDYTDSNCMSTTNSSVTCADVLERANYNGTTCYCETKFTLDTTFEGDVYFYYGLTNYYQNHRRYVRSRDDNQLLGNKDAVSSDCQPFQKTTNGSNLDLTPCGAIANSRFNDSLSLSYNGNGNESVPFTNLGIAWSTDKAVKFKNPSGASTFFPANPHPPNWQITAWDLDPNNTDNNGYQNEDFIVWMRTAAMPTFRKLYRKLQRSSSGSFQNGLPQGNYTLTVTYTYPVKSFSGRKQFIISTTSWMGGKNPFLGWAYIAVGIVCMITFVVFFILHKTWKTQNRPPIFSPEYFPKEESSQLAFVSSSCSREQQNNISSQTCNISSNLSGIIPSCNENNSNKQIAIGNLPNNESSDIKMFMVTSPSQSDDISFEEKNLLLNELTDNVNLSSLSFLQTKQRKIDHRRNKSEPVINTNLEDLSSINSSYTRPSILESSSTSTTSNESAISSNASFEKKRKSSKKTLSPSRNLKKNMENNNSPQIQDKSSSTTKKKKPWYNVSLFNFLQFFSF